jgi:hypothetical protein
MSLKRWNGSAWVTVAGSRPGPQGATGPTGAAATISVGTVTTVPAGTAATITNGGSAGAAIFNFQIPAGPTGAAGTAGAQGTPGLRGSYTFTGIANPTAQNPAQKNGLDTYLNVTTGDYFQYNSSTEIWGLVGNIKGPAGETGTQGLVGPTGATGPAGETAVQNVMNELDSWKADQVLNLGVYYPKYQTLANMTMNNSVIQATSMIF